MFLIFLPLLGLKLEFEVYFETVLWCDGLLPIELTYTRYEDRNRISSSNSRPSNNRPPSTEILIIIAPGYFSRKYGIRRRDRKSGFLKRKFYILPC